MKARVAKEEKDLAKGKRNLPYTQEDLEAHKEMAELVSKHITECEVSWPLCTCQFFFRCHFCTHQLCVCVRA